jgi:hypothetical protein
MLVVIFLNGMDNGLVRECDNFDMACSFIQSIGEERINKVVITDLQPTKTVTKKDIKDLMKW